MAADTKSRLRPEVPERRSMRLMANDEKALDVYFSSYLDDDDGDEDYVPYEEWKQVPLCVCACVCVCMHVCACV